MKKHLTAAVVLIAIALSLTPVASEAQLAQPGECYGLTGTFSVFPVADLVRIDTAAGTTSFVGPTGAAGPPAQYFAFTGLAINSTGQLYAVHRSGNFVTGQDGFLYSINASTGAASVSVALSGGAGQFLSALAFDDADVLYAVRTSTDELVTIDVATGAQAVVMSLAPVAGVRKFGGLAFDKTSGLLYASTSNTNIAGEDNAIYVIDLDVMSLTKVGNLFASAQTGGIPALLTDRTGDLYAIKNPPGQSTFPPTPGDTYAVNKSTGAGTFLGDNSHHVTGADCFNPPVDDEPVAIDVDIDVFPGQCPNKFNTAVEGLLVMSIQGTADFDVSTIDPTTLTLNGVSPVHVIYEDTSTPAGDEACACTSDGPDGIVDLKLHFEQQDILATMGPVANGDVVTLLLEGATNDATPIEGEDCVGIKIPKGQALGKDGTSPFSFELAQNYPNPFNPTTTFSFTIPVESRVDLVIYNTMGQEVRRLTSGDLGAGSHTVNWDATDQFGRALPSGTYIYRLTADEFVETRSMLLLK